MMPIRRRAQKERMTRVLWPKWDPKRFLWCSYFRFGAVAWNSRNIISDYHGGKKYRRRVDRWRSGHVMTPTSHEDNIRDVDDNHSAATDVTTGRLSDRWCHGNRCTGENANKTVSIGWVEPTGRRDDASSVNCQRNHCWQLWRSEKPSSGGGRRGVL